MQNHLVHRPNRYKATQCTTKCMLIVQNAGPPGATWCTMEVGGAQRRSVVHNVVLYPWGSAQHSSHKPLWMNREMNEWRLIQVPSFFNFVETGDNRLKLAYTIETQMTDHFKYETYVPADLCNILSCTNSTKQVELITFRVSSRGKTS